MIKKYGVGEAAGITRGTPKSQTKQRSYPRARRLYSYSWYKHAHQHGWKQKPSRTSGIFAPCGRAGGPARAFCCCYF